MKSMLMVCCAALVFTACNEATTPVNAPPLPKTVAEVQSAIKGKSYQVANLGLLSPFASDSAHPIDWKVQETDTSKFFRDYAAKQKQFTLRISADSTASFFDAASGKTIAGTFAVDDAVTEGYDSQEKPGIKLRLKYSDSLEFGGKKSAAVMTQSYLIQGISANELVVETGQAFNRRTVVLWLKSN